VALYALGSAISGRASSKKCDALLAWALRNEVAHPLAEHLLRMNPPQNKTEAASTLLAAVKTRQVAAVQLVLDNIAVWRKPGTRGATLHPLPSQQQDLIMCPTRKFGFVVGSNL
jgi:hypothetical protein